MKKNYKQLLTAIMAIVIYSIYFYTLSKIFFINGWMFQKQQKNVKNFNISIDKVYYMEYTKKRRLNNILNSKGGRIMFLRDKQTAIFMVQIINLRLSQFSNSPTSIARFI